jgi:hypothetical protein
MKISFCTIVAWVACLVTIFSGTEVTAIEGSVQVRVVSPRFAAEVPFGQDKITIVVEVEDATEEGIRLKSGVPVFEVPVYKDGKVNEAVKDNLDLFLKNLVSVTSYTRKSGPRARSTTVYQLTAVLRTALLGTGCQLAVAPKEVPSGAREVPAAGYKLGAEFEFRVGNSSMGSKPGDTFSSDLCLVVAPAPGT